MLPRPLLSCSLSRAVLEEGGGIPCARASIVLMSLCFQGFAAPQGEVRAIPFLLEGSGNGWAKVRATQVLWLVSVSC